MCVFNFEDGMVALSWYAWLAFRRRVSMSAIGSVIVMSGGASLAAVPQALGLGDLAPGPSAISGAFVGLWLRCRVPFRPCEVRGAAGSFYYQELLRTPGSSPACAISRRQIRHRPNLRKTECGRPHRWQRVYPRTANLGLRFAFSIRAFLAIVFSYRLSGWWPRRADRRRGSRAGGAARGPRRRSWRW